MLRVLTRYAVRASACRSIRFKHERKLFLKKPVMQAKEIKIDSPDEIRQPEPPVVQPKEYTIDEIYTLTESDDPFQMITDDNFKLESHQKTHFSIMINHIRETKRNEPHDIPQHIYEKSFALFADHFFTNLVGTRDGASRILRAFRKAHENGAEMDLMWKLYLRDVTDRFAGVILNYSTKQKQANIDPTIDLTNPAMWYPIARKTKRQVIFHTGPTNSGKTYSAFKALETAKKGIYAAPLRLLATEGYVKLTGLGLKCDLMTGDHRVEVEGATHTASTIEMVNPNMQYDVAVIDEIQLIADPDRGWAWTRALLGVNAKQVHLCGEERAIQILEKLCRDCGEELQVVRYQRLTPLQISPKIVKDLEHLEKGDCIVTFSRKDIFKLKKQIETKTRYKVAVVYGGLPPLVRLQQAKLFNSPDSQYDVLLATDAIGLGLNLNIRRVIFYTMSKFDGTTVRDLEDYEIRQIAGRAGRFGGMFPNGYATTFAKHDYELLKSALSKKVIPPIEMAGLLPMNTQIMTSSIQQEQKGLHEVLETIANYNRIDDFRYFLCNLEDLYEIAKQMHSIDLSLENRVDLLMTPVQTDEPLAMETFYKYAQAIADGTPISHLMTIPKVAPVSIGQLQLVESVYRILEMYCWLSYRYENIFDDRDSARSAQVLCRKLIELGLENTGSGERRERRNTKHGRRSRIKEERMRAIKDLRKYGIEDSDEEFY